MCGRNQVRMRHHCPRQFCKGKGILKLIYPFPFYLCFCHEIFNLGHILMKFVENLIWYFSISTRLWPWSSTHFIVKSISCVAITILCIDFNYMFVNVSELRASALQMWKSSCKVCLRTRLSQNLTSAKTLSQIMLRSARGSLSCWRYVIVFIIL